MHIDAELERRSADEFDRCGHADDFAEKDRSRPPYKVPCGLTSSGNTSCTI